ncbi:MAG: glycogen debranching protein [Acidimicrobiia bacterium]|nr:glycogen debranching protein [Acidimicrobiia bacterium]
MIALGREVCRDLEQSSSREWLETNGLGGFASGTVAGMHTRRYHGLLVAATKPPLGRQVLLAKFEETLVVGERRYELGCNRYPGVVHPAGHLFLKEFRLDPFPVFVYEVEDVELEKRVFMVHGENTTVVEYAVRGRECVLELRPLLAFRDYHATTHSNPALDGSWKAEGEVLRFAPYAGMPALYVGHNGPAVEAAGRWYYNFEYAREQERGLDSQEDLYNPVIMTYRLPAGGEAAVIASTQKRHAAEAARLREKELARRKEIEAPCDGQLVMRLMAAADQFIVARGDLHSIIAGYPWFGDWGRDAMIALPGLTLVTRRFGVARDILRAYAEFVDQGMLPNRFPDAGEKPEYNTVDATLWFFEAVRAFLAYTGDSAFVAEQIYPSMESIIDWHVRGTRYGIQMDSDGLLECGEPGVQLTWMDAKVGDWVVTPRRGKPVEVQALWYNALCVMAQLAASYGRAEEAAAYRDMAERARGSFERRFWNDGPGRLHDVVDRDAADATMRPNQILAVSLGHPILTGERAAMVVRSVQEELLTPMGLRSLSPFDSRFRGRYEGDVWSRDSAYHQGTVWAWLLGPFVKAYVRVHDGSAEARAQARLWLDEFAGHLEEAGLGQVSEIFDADAPHHARGCIAQAWSVAELLRAAVEDI